MFILYTLDSILYQSYSICYRTYKIPKDTSIQTVLSSKEPIRTDWLMLFEILNHGPQMDRTWSTCISFRTLGPFFCLTKTLSLTLTDPLFARTAWSFPAEFLPRTKESPNQDSWCMLKTEDFSIYGVFDGHGQKGTEPQRSPVDHVRTPAPCSLWWKTPQLSPSVDRPWRVQLCQGDRGLFRLTFSLKHLWISGKYMENWLVVFLFFQLIYFFVSDFTIEVWIWYQDEIEPTECQSLWPKLKVIKNIFLSAYWTCAIPFCVCVFFRANKYGFTRSTCFP